MDSQFDGLADRTRVFPRDDSRQQLGRIEVESIKVGGLEITAIGGNRYANGRLLVAGLADNSIEFEVHPGPDCAGRGVHAQLLMFARRIGAGWLRHCWAWVNDGSPDVKMDDGRTVTGDRFVEDQGASGTRVTPPWSRNTGARTFEEPGTSARTGKQYGYGEDDGGRDIDTYYQDGSDEYTLPDGRRITYRSAFEAVVQLCERNGIALEIR